MRTKALLTISACLASACFSPDGNPQDTDIGETTGTAGPTTSASQSSSISNSTANPSSSTGPTTTAEPTGATSTTASETQPSDGSSGSDTTATTSSGEMIEPLCGDGNVVASEFCFERSPTSFDLQPQVTDVGIADMSSNGLLDIVAVSWGETTGRLQIIEADGIGGFVLGESTNTLDQSSRLALADVDGDDDIDAVLHSSGGLDYYLNQGNFISGSNVANHFGSYYASSDLTLADVDGDDVLDVVSNETYNQGYRLGTITNGAWSLADTPFGLPTPGEGASGLIVGAFSFDGDADVDIVANNYYYTAAIVLTNDGSGNYANHAEPTLCPGNVNGVGYGVAADFDDDGNTDIAVTCTSGDVGVALDDGTGTFPDLSTLALAGALRLVAADLDSDGDVDLLVGSTMLDRAIAFLNDGSGAFEASEQQFMASGEVTGVAVADLNDDGAQDVVVGSYTTPGRIQIYLSNP